MMSHAEARSLIAEAFFDVMHRGGTESELQALQAVAWLETSYGAGWRGAGEGSNNMGAITDPSCGPLSFVHRDSRNVNSKVVWYETCFAGYATPLAGFEGLVRTMYVTRPTVLAAASRGDLVGVSSELRHTSYYLGIANTIQEQIAAHVTRMQTALSSITSSLGEKLALGAAAVRRNPGKTAGGAFALALLGLGALAWTRRKS